MLLQLQIKNYAIIDDLAITFGQGLTSLTGETGAGKSIILGALSLILGERADTSVLIDKEKKCIIEATFSFKERPDLALFFDLHDLDFEEETTIRREINSKGKSRAFINDSPTTLATLAGLGEQIVDLHRQFDTQQIHQQNFQFNVIDNYAQNSSLIQSFQALHSKHTSINNKITCFQKKLSEDNKEQEYKTFLYQELQDAHFVEEELENLEQQLKSALHQEDVSNSIQTAQQLLNDQEVNILDLTEAASSQVRNAAKYKDELTELEERMVSVQEELKDIYQELCKSDSEHEYSQEELATWQERLDLGFKLQKKHQVNSTNELIDLQKRLSEELELHSSSEEELATLQAEASKLEKEMNTIALEIRSSRTSIIPKFETQLNKLLAQVGMPNAQIKVLLDNRTSFNAYGKDNLAILLDANKSNNFQPISKVASGGELSRIMLCVKALASEEMTLATMIYDEVDSAISGEAAKQVAFLIKKLAIQHQIIVITHQAQMAALADDHLFIYKKENPQTGRITTKIRSLEPDERVLKIAQMIGGDHPSDAAILNVKEMMSRTI